MHVIVDREAFAAYGACEVWLEHLAARLELRDLDSDASTYELLMLGVDPGSVLVAMWRYYNYWHQRWYQPYLFDHQERRIPGYRTADGRKRMIERLPTL